MIEAAVRPAPAAVPISDGQQYCSDGIALWVAMAFMAVNVVCMVLVGQLDAVALFNLVADSLLAIAGHRGRQLLHVWGTWRRRRNLQHQQRNRQCNDETHGASDNDINCVTGHVWRLSRASDETRNRSSGVCPLAQYVLERAQTIGCMTIFKHREHISALRRSIRSTSPSPDQSYVIE